MVRCDPNDPNVTQMATRGRPWLLLLACVLGCLAAPLADTSRAAEEITTFGQFYGLPQAQAITGMPVRYRGIVVCYDAGWGQLYVHDGSQAGWFSPRAFSTAPAVGQFVEITAMTAVIEGVTTLTNLSLTILREGTLPAAKRLALGQLSGDLGQWIEVSGRVRAVDTSWERLALTIHENGKSCQVFVMGPPGTNSFKTLLGATVRARGINATKAIASRGDAPAVFTPGMAQLIVIQPAVANLASPEVSSIGGLLERELGDWTNQPVRVNGLVVLCQPRQSIVVQDPTGVIRAEIMQLTQAAAGQRVDVRGYLKLTPDGPVLSDASFELVKPPQRNLPTAANPGSVKPDGLPQLLTRASDILKLRPEEAAWHLPVRLRGVVTFADLEWGNAFLQDQSGGVFVQLQQKNVRAGQWVELTGQTGPGGFAPEILNAAMQVLGTTNFPPPARVDLADLMGGHLEAQWVEIEGLVRRVSVEWGHLHLRLMTSRGSFNAVVPDFYQQPSPTQLIDARVRIRGAYGSDLNSRGQLIGIRLNVPALDQITTIEPAPADPFAIVSTPIAALARFDSGPLAGRRVKVSGVVTLRIPGLGFFVQDASGGIKVHTQQTNTFEGDQVDVAGFPAFGDFSPTLEEAAFRPTGKAPLPVALATTAEQILLHGTNDGQVVSLEARLLQSVRRVALPQLVLQAGSTIFTAHLATPSAGLELPPLAAGSVVRLTGVCSIDGGERHEPESFQLWLRSPADVVLLSAPPWWTARQMFWGFVGVGLVMVVALAWVGALRQQVRQQTGTLREEIAERKRTEAALRESERMLKESQATAKLGSYVLDIATGFWRSSDVLDEVFGIDPAYERSVEGWAALIHPDDRTKMADYFRNEVVGQGRVFDQDYRILRRDNQAECWVHGMGKMEFDDQGRPVKMHGTIQDISQRKRAQAELEKLHKELVDVSRRAGMAEVATNVLHNVGNVLNSVNVSTSLIVQSVKQSRASSLARVVVLLQEHPDDLGAFITQDTRGKHLPAHLAQLSKHLLAEQETNLGELDSLRRNVEHIKEIVAMQQNYATFGGVTEMINVADLVEDSLRMNEGALGRHRVEVIREFEPVPPLNVEKHKVLQILVNLLRNAKHACQDSERADKRLTVRVANGDGRVRISVMDNGIGIPPENLTRIFSHGFTTRKDGHGFGLHSGALAAKEMDGSLTVHSDGPGQGATFTLELPCPAMEI